jgi:hypothetical protein
MRLQFEATDYYADTWIDGRFVGRHEGYIDPYEFDITTVKAGAEHESPFACGPRFTTTGATVRTPSRAPTALWIRSPTTSPLSASPDPSAWLRAKARSCATSPWTRASPPPAAPRSRYNWTPTAIEGYRWEVTLSPRNFTSNERYRVTGTPAAASSSR